MFTKKTVKDINLKGKRVLMRADYNVPIKDGKITDDYRIRQSLKTIEYILDNDASLIIISHLGRPKGPDDKDCSLQPVAKHLSHLLDMRVDFAPDCIGLEVKKAVADLDRGKILLLENVRFNPGEKKNDTDFAKAIAEDTGAQVFVQDGFGVVHRADASTDAITHFLPAVAGLLLEREVDTITDIMQKPQRPLVAVVGGAKITDKIEVLDKLIDLADCVAVAGAMANNFLLAERIPVGKSLVELEALNEAREILRKARQTEKKRNFSFLVPQDVVVSTDLKGTKPTRVVDISSHSLADIQAYPKLPKLATSEVSKDEAILDIGPTSAAQIAGAIKVSKTVLWNGTCGITEVKGIAGAAAPFAHGTKMIVDAMIGSSNSHVNKPFSLVGGGDTASYVEEQGLVADFNHVSTGGGASLELIAGHKLPGVEALLNK